MRIQSIGNFLVAYWFELCDHSRNQEVANMSDDINKTIELNAPVERVWRAITDHSEFGQWFRVNLEGPFRPGEESRGPMTYPGYEHIVWRAKVVAMDEPLLFSFNWHPYAVDPNVDYSKETPTVVEF